MKHALALLIVLALPIRAHADASAAAEKSVVMLEQIATIVDTNQANCDAMGDKLDKFMDSNAAQIKELKAAGKTMTEEQQKAFQEKYKERLKAVTAKMRPGLSKCSSNAKVTSAMKKGEG